MAKRQTGGNIKPFAQGGKVRSLVFLVIVIFGLFVVFSGCANNNSKISVHCSSENEGACSFDVRTKSQ